MSLLEVTVEKPALVRTEVGETAARESQSRADDGAMDRTGESDERGSGATRTRGRRYGRTIGRLVALAGLGLAGRRLANRWRTSTGASDRGTAVPIEDSGGSTTGRSSRSRRRRIGVALALAGLLALFRRRRRKRADSAADEPTTKGIDVGAGPEEGVEELADERGEERAEQSPEQSGDEATASDTDGEDSDGETVRTD